MNIKDWVTKIFTKNNNRDSTTEENKDKGQEDNVSIEVKKSEDLSFGDCNQGLSKEMTKSVGENVEVVLAIANVTNEQQRSFEVPTSNIEGIQDKVQVENVSIEIKDLKVPL